MALFTLEREEYKRNLNIIQGYCEQTALYLSKMTAQPVEKCLDFVRQNIQPGGLHPIKDPEVFYLTKETPGNREKANTTFSSYLGKVVQDDLLIAPTMAVYLPPEKKKSLIARYIQGNLDKRNKFKKLMFIAKMDKDLIKQGFFKNLQNTCKIKNNSVSGAHASPYTILYNKSSHSTLTSTCRSAASYGNANNEKFLMGNRYYWSPDVTLANVLAIVKYSDYPRIQAAMDTYNLHYPTTDEVMDCITYSTKQYWNHPGSTATIRELVDRLAPIEKAAFVYTADLYHLAKHNQQFVRTFFDDMIALQNNPHSDPNPVMKGLSADMAATVSLLRADITRGMTFDKLEKASGNGWALVAGAAEYLNNTLDKYGTLIQGLWRPTTLPASIAGIKYSVRKCVVVSDTDSTIFSNQYWTCWYRGKMDFSRESNAVGCITTYLTSQLVSHLLAMFSANVGAKGEALSYLRMKNEYYFPVFVITPRAKHYFAFKSAQEGNVYDEMEMEVKGVELVSSNAPPETMEILEEYMKQLMNSIIENNELTIDEILRPVAKLERDIIEDIGRGGFKYMRTMQIKDPSSYTAKEENPNYGHYKLWEEVFAFRYGSTVPPPYRVVKISVDLDKPSKLQRWIDSIEDRALALRLDEYCKKNNRTNFSNLMFPLELLELNGIPKEVIPIISTRQLIFNVMAPFYLVLESFGFYMINDRLTRLVSDTYPV